MHHLVFGYIEEEWLAANTFNGKGEPVIPFHLVYGLVQLLDARTYLQIHHYRPINSEPRIGFSMYNLSQAREKTMHLQLCQMTKLLVNDFATFRQSAEHRLAAWGYPQRPTKEWWVKEEGIVMRTQNVAAQGLWSMDPISYGTICSSISVFGFDIGLSIWECDNLLQTVLHLYNACLQGHEGVMKPSPLFEELCCIFNKRVFQGCRPHTITFGRNYLASYSLSVGTRAEAFAKDSKQSVLSKDGRRVRGKNSGQMADTREKVRCLESGVYALQRSNFMPFEDPVKSRLPAQSEFTSNDWTKPKRKVTGEDTQGYDFLRGVQDLTLDGLGYRWETPPGPDSVPPTSRINFLVVDVILQEIYEEVVMAVTTYHNKLVTEENGFRNFPLLDETMNPTPKDFMLDIWFPLLLDHEDAHTRHTIALTQEAITKILRLQLDKRRFGGRGTQAEWFKLPRPDRFVGRAFLDKGGFNVQEFVDDGGCLKEYACNGTCHCWYCFIAGVQRSQYRQAESEVCQGMYPDIQMALVAKEVPDEIDWAKWVIERQHVISSTHGFLKIAVEGLLEFSASASYSELKYYNKGMLKALLPPIWELAEKDLAFEDDNMEIHVIPRSPLKKTDNHAVDTPCLSVVAETFLDRCQNCGEEHEPKSHVPWLYLNKPRVRKEASADDRSQVDCMVEAALELALFNDIPKVMGEFYPDDDDDDDEPQNGHLGQETLEGVNAKMMDDMGGIERGTKRKIAVD